MRSAFGLSLIAAGIVVGAYGLVRYLPDETEPEIAVLRPVVAAAISPSTISPSTGNSVLRSTPTNLQDPSVLPEPVRGIAQPPNAQRARMASPLARAPALATPTDHEGLARELQRELRRAGCYEGAINGVWTPATRSAMQRFTERVNATLPLDKPDVVLLALVQNEANVSCSPCPEGQRSESDRRCALAPLVAYGRGAPPREARGYAPSQPPHKEPVVIARSSTMPTPSHSVGQAPHAPLEGRMGMGGPFVAPAGKNTQLAATPGPDARLAEPTREPRSAHYHRGQRLAGARLRAYRPPRFAYRPFRRYGGFAAVLFGRF